MYDFGAGIKTTGAHAPVAPPSLAPLNISSCKCALGQTESPREYLGLFSMSRTESKKILIPKEFFFLLSTFIKFTKYEIY